MDRLVCSSGVVRFYSVNVTVISKHPQVGLQEILKSTHLGFADGAFGAFLSEEGCAALGVGAYNPGAGGSPPYLSASLIGLCAR